MNKQDLKELKGAKQIYIQSNDPRFNYSFHKEKDIVEFEKQPDIINISQYDYSFKRDDGGDTKLPDLISSSELASFQNLEDMEEFYRQKHPTLPDEYFGIMARYSTGNPITKKEVKNTLKKVKKNSNKSYPVGFKVVTGDFVLDFD
jgi:hypothetical protein|tara:strand:- start:1002 stop:1439 length:438 start_codon:yes stop_codon:yes gene_type:complete